MAEADFAAMETHGAIASEMGARRYRGLVPRFETATGKERQAFWTGPSCQRMAEQREHWDRRPWAAGRRWVRSRADRAPATGAQLRLWRPSRSSAPARTASPFDCAVRIAARQVARQWHVSRGMRDWGPFHSASKREDMRGWVSEQSYCAAPAQ